ncbi:hypothetical protein EV06_1497 [Prochlorococcus sp. MIT 0602]|nr:hypothetical protein EV06_1497 [Prochlorococcus sp. MIT 0602]KGG17180.1 hypothetical protein EV07_0615 [Prochlorococcus sp. MIT 0603]
MQELSPHLQEVGRGESAMELEIFSFGSYLIHSLLVLSNLS